MPGPAIWPSLTRCLSCYLSAVILAKKTAGAFDVTVGPLVELWRNAGENNRLPRPDEITSTLTRVGYEKLVLQPPDEVSSATATWSLTSAALAKATAIDRILSFLRRAGVTAALINFGGSSIGAIGAPSGKNYWEIAIQNTADRLHGAIRLRNEVLGDF